MSDNRAAKQKRILNCALKILTERGDAGLTMRRLADCSGMRLSNLQYYFKSKDDVLSAMVSSYFESCATELRAIAEAGEPQSPRERARNLLSEAMRHGAQLSDMCRVFRELWAISSRNPVVRDKMQAYYETLCTLIGTSVSGGDGTPKQAQQIGSLLLPFIEGYSITASSLPLPPNETAELLVDLAVHIIEND